MTAKPIVVVYFPQSQYELQKVVKSIEHLNMDKPDYHWFILPDYDTEKIYMQVFYEKDFTDIKYDELKQYIHEQINKTT